jgi:hypothetical protein
MKGSTLCISGVAAHTPKGVSLPTKLILPLENGGRMAESGRCLLMGCLLQRVSNQCLASKKVLVHRFTLISDDKIACSLLWWLLRIS